MHTIAYLGPAGTFSEEAAIRYAGDRGDVAYLPLASIPAVVTAIETDAATVGLLPIENLLRAASASPSICSSTRPRCRSRGRRSSPFASTW